ncbi:MAG: hypothetical protein WCJ92_03395 [Alphaproteobacteria bacterium]
MVLLSVSLLQAADVEGGFLAALMARAQPHANPESPEHKNGEILEHANVENSVVSLPSQAEVLEGQVGNAELKQKGDAILGSANAPDPVRDELHKQETVEHLKKYPVVSGQGPNEDESELDLMLEANLDGVGAVRMAKPAVEKAG